MIRILVFLLVAFALGCGNGGSGGDRAAGPGDAPPPGGAPPSENGGTPPPTDGGGTLPPPNGPPGEPQPVDDGWVRVRHERFDAPLPALDAWRPDVYGTATADDPWADDGAFFFAQYARHGADFGAALAEVESFRRSVRFGQDGWLTLEFYTRAPERSDHPTAEIHRASDGNRSLELSTAVHTDATEVRGTEALPARYRLRLKVTPIALGGRDPDGVWRRNGYSDGTERAGPWRFTDASIDPAEAWRENGAYFLAILDTVPRPHNNVWIHHHRKVVIDSDSNVYPEGPWSRIWNGLESAPDGSRPLMMLALDGEFGDPWVGNPFYCFYANRFERGCTTAADAFIDGQTYRVMIERNATHYVLEVAGRFRHGGETVYRDEIDFRAAAVWHYNQTAAGAPPNRDSQPLARLGIDWRAWPADSAYPDYFMFGDPHINYYEGVVRYDDLELWLPVEAAAKNGS